VAASLSFRAPRSDNFQGKCEESARMAIDKVMLRLRSCVGAMVGIGAAVAFMPTVAAQDTVTDKAKIEAGENVYNNNCAPCHGDQLVSTGQFPNLRKLTANDYARFESTVHNGKNQMPPWKGVLSDGEIDQVWAYVRANAYQK
jgi:mono/diheme cytochrome c family protein